MEHIHCRLQACLNLLRSGMNTALAFPAIVATLAAFCVVAIDAQVWSSFKPLANRRKKTSLDLELIVAQSGPPWVCLQLENSCVGLRRIPWQRHHVLSWLTIRMLAAERCSLQRPTPYCNTFAAAKLTEGHNSRHESSELPAPLFGLNFVVTATNAHRSLC